jgi:hypothetical protein
VARKAARKKDELSLITDVIARTFGDGLPEEYRRAVEASLDLQDACLTNQFWAELETVIRTFLSLQERRLRKPPRQEYDRWCRIAEHAGILGGELRALRWEIPWTQRPDIKRALEVLWEIKDSADARMAGYGTLIEAFRHGHQHRWYLYASILDLWKWLGGELKYSMSPKGVPYGPLIRFVEACVNPLLIKPLKASGISSFVDRRLGRRGRNRVYAPQK